MTLDPSRFHALADETLKKWLTAIDRDLGDMVEVDIESDVLTIDCAKAGQYILNKNEPLRQIWLSSPLSGAWHFDWNEAEGAWLSSRHDHVTLTEVLAGELEKLTGLSLTR